MMASSSTLQNRSILRATLELQREQWWLIIKEALTKKTRCSTTKRQVLRSQLLREYGIKNDFWQRFKLWAQMVNKLARRVS